MNISYPEENQDCHENRDFLASLIHELQMNKLIKKERFEKAFNIKMSVEPGISNYITLYTFRLLHQSFYHFIILALFY